MVVAVGLLILLAYIWMRIGGPDIPLSELHVKFASADSHYVDLPGDIRLHYRELGPPDAEPVLLLHGYGDSFTAWDGWAPLLAPRFRLLIVDLPGHGLTAAPRNFQLSTATYVAVLREFLDALRIARCALVGNSMGGGIAWQYALHNPNQVSALVLVDAAGWPLPPPSELPLAFRILQYRLGRWLLAKIDNAPLIANGLKQNVADPALITSKVVERWAAFQRAPGHRQILMSASPAAFAIADPNQLSGIHIPTLVMHGERDSLIPVSCGYRFAACIPDAKLVTYPDVGHLPQLEIPEESAEDARRFLETAIGNVRS